jgi:thioredoxin 1
MKKTIQITIWGIFLAIAVIIALKYPFGQQSDPVSSSHSAGIPTVPVKGMVTMLDLGATECVPCKLMAPIMAELEKEYHGRAAIVFIDVWKHPDQAQKFGIQAIPTQIFFNKEGKEVFRHTGFMDKKSIVDRLKQLGAV